MFVQINDEYINLNHVVKFSVYLHPIDKGFQITVTFALSHPEELVKYDITATGELDEAKRILSEVEAKLINMIHTKKMYVGALSAEDFFTES